MTPQRWAQVNEAFSAALDLEAADRGDFLDRLGADDVSLRDEVVRLLRDAMLADGEGFLKEPAWVAYDTPLFLPDFKDGDSAFSAIEYIGQGGMGIVYKAYHRNFDRWVALKFSSPPHLMSSSDVERFRAEAQSMARLRHPNIVTVHETGEFQGRPYFIMELIDGKSLHDCVSEFAGRPREAAALLEAVALAVHHAHQRRILHNDLKPANILLDDEGQPHITDFGLARRFGEGAAGAAAGAIEGSASFMSPEQADGKELTTASDVYALGAILYMLLTGTPPFHGGTVQQILQRVRTQAPEPPRRLKPDVDRTLEAICLKCLHKDKAKRYPSANGLANDLIRYRTGKETTALPWTRRVRIAQWCQRNVVEAGLVAAVVAIWIFAVVMALSVAQARKTDLLQATLNGAGLAARDLATTALLQLRSVSRNVELATADPELPALLARDDRAGMERIVLDVCNSYSIPLVTCYIIDRRGIMVAHAPRSDFMIGRDFSWRNHFQGAKALGEQRARGSVHISRVYRGQSDNLYKFAISAPILDDNDNFLGTIASSVTTDASMGGVFMHDDRRKVALIAPRDIDSPAHAASSGASDYVVLFHPAYRKGIDAVPFPDVSRIGFTPALANGQELQLPSPNLANFQDDNYQDPVAAIAGDYAGRWIAGFAPVGRTGFVVVVQQRFADAVSLESSTFWNLALWSALASLVAVGILVVLPWYWFRSRRLHPD